MSRDPRQHPGMDPAPPPESKELHCPACGRYLLSYGDCELIHIKCRKCKAVVEMRDGRVRLKGSG